MLQPRFSRGHLLSLLDSLLGAVSVLPSSRRYGAGARIYLRWRGMEGMMGFGDVKLMAMVGAFLGM